MKSFVLVFAIVFIARASVCLASGAIPGFPGSATILLLLRGAVSISLIAVHYHLNAFII
jgi:hypothetical protein